jgi:transcriptional repressor NrdR
MPLKVIKKDGARVQYSRDKVLHGVEKALEKRPVGADEIENMIDELEREILDSNEREVSAEHIGELVMEKLRRLDQVAYIRFASVYRDFKAVDEFVATINTIEEKRDAGGENP